LDNRRYRRFQWRRQERHSLARHQRQCGDLADERPADQPVRGVRGGPTNWTIVETGDFDDDGKSDTLWQDKTGNVAVWLMNGAQISQIAGVGVVPTVWSAQGINAD